MTVHAPTDVRAIAIPAERGGCGQVHEAGDLAEGQRFAVDCAQCEPHIIATRTGWSHNPAAVALTPDEIGEVELQETEAKRQANRTWGNPALLGQALAKAMAPAPAEAPSLLAQIAALSPEERAALAAMLTASTPTPETVPTDAPPPPAKATKRAAAKKAALPPAASPAE